MKPHAGVPSFATTEPVFIAVLGPCFDDVARLQEALHKLRGRVEVPGVTEMVIVCLGIGYASNQASLWAAGVGVGKALVHVPYAAQETGLLDYFERALAWYECKAVVLFSSTAAKARGDAREDQLAAAREITRAAGIKIYNVEA